MYSNYILGEVPGVTTSGFSNPIPGINGWWRGSLAAGGYVEVVVDPLREVCGHENSHSGLQVGWEVARSRIPLDEGQCHGLHHTAHILYL